jgi:hypothetical protein
VFVFSIDAFIDAYRFYFALAVTSSFSSSFFFFVPISFVVIYEGEETEGKINA